MKFFTIFLFASFTALAQVGTTLTLLDQYAIILIETGQVPDTDASRAVATANAYNKFTSQAYDRKLTVSNTSDYIGYRLNNDVLLKARENILVAKNSYTTKQVGTLSKKWEVVTTVYFTSLTTGDIILKREAVTKNKDWSIAYSEGLSQCYADFLSLHPGFNYLKTRTYQNSLMSGPNGPKRDHFLFELQKASNPHPWQGAWVIENQTRFGVFEIFITRTIDDKGGNKLTGWLSDPMYSNRASGQIVFTVNEEERNGSHQGAFSENHHTIVYRCSINYSNNRLTIEIEDAIWGKLPTLTLRQVVHPPISAAASAGAKGEENLPKNLNQESESKAKSSGSGFLVSRSGIVATNYHVIEDAKQIIVMLPNDNRKYTARVIANDKRNDLALIQIDDFPANSYKDKIPYKIKSTQAVQISNKVFTIGYPLTSFLGTKPKFSDGTISSITGPRDDPRLLQMNASIQPGNSGGPLFSIAGEVVGIVVASANAKFFYDELGVIPQNVNFAVKSDYLLSLLFSEKIKIDQEFDSLAKVESIEEFSERVLKYCPIIFSY